MNVLIWMYKNFDFFTSNYNINNMRILKKYKENEDQEDIAVIEGAISSHKQKETLEKIRKNAKKIVVIGSCAINGSPSNNRNFLKYDDEIKKYIEKFDQLEKVYAVKDIIKVDAEVPGCPILIQKFDELMRTLTEENKTK